LWKTPQAENSSDESNVQLWKTALKLASLLRCLSSLRAEGEAIQPAYWIATPPVAARDDKDDRAKPDHDV
jgi:hypothetical protein